MNLAAWVLRHGIPQSSIVELNQIFGTGTPPASNQSEAAVSQRVRLQASVQGARLWRNNVGVWIDDRGVPIRYGLCNESASQNQALKSSDLIGITPVVIRQEHVGLTVGVFTAYEIKEGDWSYRGVGREGAQLAFLQLVAGMGGIAKFVNSEDDI